MAKYHSSDKKQVYNIEMFGAVPSGTDIASFIQAANDKAVADNVFGTIEIPSGAYKLGSDVQIDSRNSLVGNGVNSTLIDTNSGGTDHSIQIVSTGVAFGSWSEFGDFYLLGSKTGIAHGIELISDAYYSHMRFYNLIIDSFGGDGFRALAFLTGKPNHSIFMSKFENVRSMRNNGKGFACEIGTSLSFDYCYASACKQSGFFIRSNAYGSIQNSASEECGIAWELTNNRAFNLYNCGSEQTADYSVAYPGICLQSTDNFGCTYQGLHLSGFQNYGGNGTNKRYFKFDGDYGTKVSGVFLTGSTGGSSINPDFSYEIINGAVVSLENIRTFNVPAFLPKIGSGEFIDVSKSYLHGSKKGSKFWRVDEQIDYQSLATDLTLTVDSPGTLHLNGGTSDRLVHLPIPTNMPPNLHGMIFKIKNIGATNNLVIREGAVTRGTLLPNEHAEYKWDGNFPRYFEWK